MSLRSLAPFRLDGVSVVSSTWTTALFVAVDTAPELLPPLAAGGMPMLRNALNALAAGDGVDINATDYGWTPLAWAVARDKIDIVSALLAAGADPDAGAYAASPLWAAMARGKKEPILMLLRAGATITGARCAWLDHCVPDRVSQDNVSYPPWSVGPYLFDECLAATFFMKRVRDAGGYEAYKDMRYRECVAAHLVARERRLPTEILDVLLNSILQRRTVTIGVFDCFTSQGIPIATYTNLKRWTPLSQVFDAYPRYAQENLGAPAGVELCYRLPNSETCLSRESTVQSLDAAIRDQHWGSQKRFDGYLHIYAHDAHRPADYLSPFATTMSHANGV